MARPEIPIPAKPEAPYPITIKNTKVIAGFGRGSSAIGIPTANVPVEDIPHLGELTGGVYFGYVKLLHPSKSKKRGLGSGSTTTAMKKEQRQDGKSEVEVNFGELLRPGEDCDVVLPMVMSLGWNPFFKNEKMAAELHIMHDFKDTFYGCELNFNILGYIRPELDYTTLDALIEDINLDIKIALEYLDKEGYKPYQADL